MQKSEPFRVGGHVAWSAAVENGVVAPCAAAVPGPGVHPEAVRPYQRERQRLDLLKDVVERGGDIQGGMRTLVSAP